MSMGMALDKHSNLFYVLKRKFNLCYNLIVFFLLCRSRKYWSLRGSHRAYLYPAISQQTHICILTHSYQKVLYLLHVFHQKQNRKSIHFVVKRHPTDGEGGAELHSDWLQKMAPVIMWPQCFVGSWGESSKWFNFWSFHVAYTMIVATK